MFLWVEKVPIRWGQEVESGSIGEEKKSPNLVRNRGLEFQFGDVKISICLFGENIKSDSYDFVSKKVQIRWGQDVEMVPIGELKRSQFGEA